MSEDNSNLEALNEIFRLSQSCFREGRFQEAEKILDKGLAVDFEDQRLISAMKSAAFWKERSLRLQNIGDDFEKSEYLIKEWKSFQRFEEKCCILCEQDLYAVKEWVFGTALSGYLNMQSRKDLPEEAMLLKIGRCYKAMGDYEKALEYLEGAASKHQNSSEILSELADCYAFINEPRYSKALFREAFFIDPSEVDLDFLESELICRLIERIEEIGYSGKELQEWVPVYGVLWGVFNVKRELRPLEYGKLKQTIFSLENQINSSGVPDENAVPRLLNRYFWLIDHYISTKDTRDKVEEVLGKIQVLNEEIYKQYIN